VLVTRNGIKKWIKRLGLVLALPLMLVLLAGLWTGYKIISHGQSDDEVHLAAKNEYLKSISDGKISNSEPEQNAPPNIVFILYDDMGYGDLGFTGNRAIKTPAIDQLAADGVTLSNFYSPSPICSPSRAGFLTGRYAPRAGLPNVVFPTGNPKSLLNIFSSENIRLPAEEITIAEMLEAAGYNTGMIGKWHMGDREPSLPNNFGFDQFFGALYSNDMVPFALYRDAKVVEEAPFDQTQLDARYTGEAVQFIEDQQAKDNPFFLYFAHNFPHIPLFVPPDRSGQSAAGTYGDVIEGLDRGVAKIVAALRESGELENTIIIISSDNGPWYEGSAGFARGRKGQTLEGGMHVPFLIHWPEGLEGGRSLDGISMGIDLLPTLADWVGLPLPKDRIIDGKSIRTMLETGGETPHDYLYYFANEKLMAVRNSDFKYLAKRAHIYQANDSDIGLPSPQEPWLINMKIDDNESYDVTAHDPKRAAAMRKILLSKHQEMKVNKRGWIE